MTSPSSLSSSLLRIISQNIGPLVIAQLISFFVNFLQLIYLARILAPGHFGIISLALSIQFFAMMFTNLGTSFMGTRELVIRRKYDPLLFWNITALRLVLIMPCIGAAVAWLTLSESDPALSGITLIFLFTVIPVIITPDWVFTGLEMMKINSLIKIIISILGFVLTVIWVNGPDDVIIVPFTYLISTSIGVLIGFVYLRKIGGKWNFKVQPSLWSGYIKKSLKIGIASYLIVAIGIIDVFIIGLVLTNTDVGYYSAASKLILSIHTLLGLVATGIFPAVTRTIQKDPELVKSLTYSAITIILTLEIPLCMVISLNSDIIIHLIYGKKYEQTIPVLALLIWSIIPVSLSHIYSSVLNATYRESIIIRILFVQLSLILPLMVVGTLMFGIIATAGTIVFVGFIISIVYAIQFRNEVTVPKEKIYVIFILTMSTFILHRILVLLFTSPLYDSFHRVVPIVFLISGIIALRILPINRLLQIIQCRD